MFLCVMQNAQVKKNQSADHTEQMLLKYHNLANFPGVFSPLNFQIPCAHFKVIACQILLKIIAKFEVTEAQRAMECSFLKNSCNFHTL